MGEYFQETDAALANLRDAVIRLRRAANALSAVGLTIADTIWDSADQIDEAATAIHKAGCAEASRLNKEANESVGNIFKALLDVKEPS